MSGVLGVVLRRGTVHGGRSETSRVRVRSTMTLVVHEDRVERTTILSVFSEVNLERRKRGWGNRAPAIIVVCWVGVLIRQPNAYVDLKGLAYARTNTQGCHRSSQSSAGHRSEVTWTLR